MSCLVAHVFRGKKQGLEAGPEGRLWAALGVTSPCLGLSHAEAFGVLGAWRCLRAAVGGSLAPAKWLLKPDTGLGWGLVLGAVLLQPQGPQGGSSKSAYLQGTAQTSHWWVADRQAGVE